MGSESSSPEQWDRVAAELMAYRDHQRQTWGDLDNEVIGRYLADEVAADERAQVEAAFADHPDLLMLTELVRDVLAEPRPAVPEPVILSFSQAAPVRHRLAPRARRWFAVAAAACILFLMGSLFSRPSLLPYQGYTNEALGLHGLSADLSLGEEPVQVVSLDEARHFRVQSFSMKAERVAAPAPPSDPVAEPALLASADGWHRSGVKLQQQGQLGDAEAQLRRAYGVRKQAWGQEDPRTLDTLDNLTAIYADVLAVNAARAGRKESEARKIAESQVFFAKHGQVLPPSAVPVLVDGIEQGSDSELGERCARALSEIGAGDLPVIQALEKIEKGGPTERHREAARQALERMRKPGSLAGVRDLAGLYRARTLALVNPRLQKLAEQHNFVLVIETVPTLPQNRDTRTDYVRAWSQDRAQRNPAPRALYVLVSQNPPAARIAHTSSEKKQDYCCSPEFAHTLGCRIQDSLKQKDPDQGLVEAVNLLTTTLEGKGRR